MPPLLFKGVSLIASMSVGKVITGIVKNNVTSTNVVGKTANWIGAAVLGAMAMDKASTYVDEQLKKFAEEVEEAKQKREKLPESSESSKKDEAPE